MKSLKASILLFALCASAAIAAPELSLDSQARGEVENDVMTVVMSVHKEGAQVQPLTQATLATLQRAAAKAKRTSEIEVSVGTVNSYPSWRPNDSHSPTWTVRAELTLNSSNFASLGTLASELTSDMQIASVRFSLSPAKRQAQEARLIDDAAKAFKAKAGVLSRALGFNGFEIKRVQFGQQYGGGYYPVPMAATAAPRAADAAVPVPTEGGKSEVIVTMGGMVELN